LELGLLEQLGAWDTNWNTSKYYFSSNHTNSVYSNTATATMILPILASLAFAINIHPFALMIPAAMAANCAFMLPVGTPPNAERITIPEMVKAGFWINIFAIFLIVLAVYFTLPLLMDINLTVFPNELK
jgi:sodium-dependent dicarboxylate transporter 2/3/5